MDQNLIPFIVVIGFMVLLVVFSFGIHFLMQKRYRRAYAKLASSMGFEFTPEHKNLVKQLSELELFKQEGTMAVVYNLVSGQVNDDRIRLFTSTRHVGSGATGTGHGRFRHYTICVAESDKLDLPVCSVSAKGFFNRFKQIPYGEWTDISFDQDPAFSTDYEVRGLNKQAVRSLLDGQLRDWLMQRRDEHLHLETNGKMFAIHYGGRVPARVGRGLMNAATELLSAWAHDEKMIQKPRVERKPYNHLIYLLPKITGICALICLAFAGMLTAFRMSHDRQLAWLEQNGTLTPVTIIKKGQVSGSSTTSKGNTSSDITYWIRYLPDGMPNEKENIIWESVHEIDFNRFEEEQRVHAWIAGDKHYIKERSGFVAPDTRPFVLVGVFLLICWFISRKFLRRLRDVYSAKSG